MEKSFDIIAIGDTVIDAFIKVNIGNVEDIAGVHEFCLPFGSKVPYESVQEVVAVGNSANAAVCGTRLGLKTGLVSFLGNDSDGLKCINQLTKEGVNTEYISQQNGKKTNYHYVLWHGDERTILIKHENFNVSLPLLEPTDWLYLSSLGQDELSLHENILDYVKAHPDTKLAFQPGTFQLALGKEKLKDVLTHTEVLCLNKEEAATLLETTDLDIKKLLDGLGMLGAKITLVTDGPHGAYMKYGDNYTSVPLYPDIAKPLERTGAGDAFCATFVSYLAKGLIPEDALLRAPINSMNVVQHVGAQEGLLHENEIEEYLKQAPAEYSLKTI